MTSTYCWHVYRSNEAYFDLRNQEVVIPEAGETEVVVEAFPIKQLLYITARL